MTNPSTLKHPSADKIVVKISGSACACRDSTGRLSRSGRENSQTSHCVQVEPSRSCQSSCPFLLRFLDAAYSKLLLHVLVSTPPSQGVYREDSATLTPPLTRGISGYYAHAAYQTYEHCSVQGSRDGEISWERYVTICGVRCIPLNIKAFHDLLMG